MAQTTWGNRSEFDESPRTFEKIYRQQKDIAQRDQLRAERRGTTLKNTRSGGLVRMRDEDWKKYQERQEQRGKYQPLQRGVPASEQQLAAKYKGKADRSLPNSAPVTAANVQDLDGMIGYVSGQMRDTHVQQASVAGNPIGDGLKTSLQKTYAKRLAAAWDGAMSSRAPSRIKKHAGYVDPQAMFDVRRGEQALANTLLQWSDKVYGNEGGKKRSPKQIAEAQRMAHELGKQMRNERMNQGAFAVRAPQLTVDKALEEAGVVPPANPAGGAARHAGGAARPAANGGNPQDVVDGALDGVTNFEDNEFDDPFGTLNDEEED